jgi:triacylglycerol lipase
MKNKIKFLSFVFVFGLFFLSTVTASAQLTTDFQTWLNANGYSAYDFNRGGNSYGGKSSASETVVNQPVIFVHGNSDAALGAGVGATGWTSSINYFASQGYKTSEMYATTWGDANPLLSGNQYHSKPNLQKIRAFIQAVKAYTGATKVDIVTHSMGVTLTRKAILGGAANDAANGGSYNLGASLTSSVDTFVGIAGANWGLVSCYQTGGTTPTCAATNGLYPGYSAWSPYPLGLSNILYNLNSSGSHYEGGFVYSIWSTADEVIGYGDVVYGRYTSQIPGQNGEKRFGAYPYGHINSKDLTGYYQWRMVKFHATN